MKWSRYNTIISNSNKDCILYNCSTNELQLVDEEAAILINNNKNIVPQIELINPELYHDLLEKKFIVNDQFDEVNDFIVQMQRETSTYDYFKLIINPTLDCNLRCWYCYEKRLKDSVMSKETLISVMNLIKNKIELPNIKQISLSFFGGEPLIKFDEVVWPLIKYTQELCIKSKKQFLVSFTTNGVLLTKQIVDILYTAKLCCTFQVPFDGNREFHNKTKKYTNGKGSYNTIFKNVIYALSKGFRFDIRCNYTHANLNSFNDLIAEFSDIASVCINYGILSFTFHKVWQVEETEGMKKDLYQIEERVSLQNLRNPDLNELQFTPCYADKENSVVINYNGDVYNCTARDFKMENREGHLDEKGIIIYNEKYQKRRKARFINPNCLNCNIFPICNICSQKILEQKNETSPCLRGFSEEDKERLLLKKIELVIG